MKAQQKGSTKTNKFEDERFYKVGGWRCKKCSKSFDSKEVYEYHMRKHEDAHVCKVCKEEFKTKLGLNVHMKEHEDDKLMQAKIVISLTLGGHQFDIYSFSIVRPRKVNSFTI